MGGSLIPFIFTRQEQFSDHDVSKGFMFLFCIHTVLETIYIVSVYVYAYKYMYKRAKADIHN